MDPNVLGERLEAANGTPIAVSGTVTLEAKFDSPNGPKSRYIQCLVSPHIEDQVIVSWYDAEAVGALTLVRQILHDNPQPADTSRSPQEIKAQIQKWLDTYSCLSDTLPSTPVKGPPMKIELVKDQPIKPKKARTPVRVPIHYQPFSDKIIDDMIRDGIIRPVERSKVSQFCARAFIVPKPNGDGFRMVVDHSEVNRFIERPTHPFVAGNELLRRIPHTARVFAKLDALSSFHQVALHPDSRHITTFIHERGMFEYMRAPQGTNCSGDFWCRVSDEALAGLPGVVKLIDDIAIYGSNYEELFARVEAVLQRCQEHGITLSRKKLEVGPSITFAGFDLSARGVTPTASRTSAIADFPRPRTVRDVRSFLGLGQQLAHFVPDWTVASEPLRELIKKKNAFTWNEPQEDAFKTCKLILTGDLVLRPFNPGLYTELVVDASRSGVGWLLLQTDPITRNRHLVQCGSQALQPAQRRYAVCELEALALYTGITKSRHYLLGMKRFTVVTDHRSLRGIFQKDLCDIENVRLRRYREKLQEYTFDVAWAKGKSNLMADALSRFPVAPPGEPDEVAGPCVCNAINVLSEVREASSDLTLEPLLAAAKSDPDYQSLIEAVSTVVNPSNLNENLSKGLPPSHPAREFDNVWKELSIHDLGLVVMRNDRIVVPKSYRQTILQKLHVAHCGLEKSKWAMSRDYYWPSCNSDLEAVIKSCSECRPLLPGLPKEIIRPMNDSVAPMDLLGSDLFQIGQNHYVVIVDEYSSYMMVEKLNRPNARAVVDVFRRYFNILGRGKRLLTDSGPQYTDAGMQKYLQSVGTQHFTSSVAFASSNGLSEASVKRAKYLLMKVNEDMDLFGDALLEYNNTPTSKNISPFEMFFARRGRTGLPILPGKTNLDSTKATTGAEDRKEERVNQYAKRSTIEHPKLNVGQKVDIMNIRGHRKGRWDHTGVIIGLTGPGRSYIVRKDDGGETRLSRRYLRPIPSSQPTSPTPHFSDRQTAAFMNGDHEDALRNDQPTAPRRGSRIRKPKDHSCTGCHSVKCLLCNT